MSNDRHMDTEEYENKLDFSEKLALIHSGKRTYIYQCNKEELIKIISLEKLVLPPSASVDELRKLLSTFYKNKTGECNINNQHQVRMSLCGELKPFDGEKWEVFEQQLECFMFVNEIPNEKRVPLLITKLTPKVFETLTYLCSPAKAIKLSYEELCIKLRNKYEKSLSTILERAEFRKRNQLPNEKVEDYVIELKKLATKCAFKDMDDQIKEKFIEGVNSKSIKFELIKSSAELTLEKCVEIARTVEAALIHIKGEQTEMFFQSKVKQFKYQPKTTNKLQNNRCFCCGKNSHLRAECSLRNKFCSECGQRGHIFKMCSKKVRNTNVLPYTARTED